MASLKKAIAAKCKDCCYDQHEKGTYLEQIENCRVKKCPLWEVRPMTVATINLIRKAKASQPAAIDLDALINELDDEDDEVQVTA